MDFRLTPEHAAFQQEAIAFADNLPSQADTGFAFPHCLICSANRTTTLICCSVRVLARGRCRSC